MGKSKKEVRRGRPALFTGNARQHVVGLLKRYQNATQVRQILGAEPGTGLAALRSDKLFPEAVKVSLPTLTKIAKAEGVEVKRGRATNESRQKFALKAGIELPVATEATESAAA